jgi:F-type H+-transporting ATPase subunit b
MQGLELSIEMADKDAVEKDQSFAAGIKEARVKGLQEKEALIQQAADEEKRVVAEINRQAQAELADLREKIKKDAVVVRESLEKEIGDFASQISQKILGRTV